MAFPCYKVFISHSGYDTWVAKQIQGHITNLGISTFLDEDGIAGGDDFEAVILREIRESKEIVVLFTPWSIHRKYVWLEIGAAWALGIRIVCVAYKLTMDEILSECDKPSIIAKQAHFQINDLDEYFSELLNRVQQHER